MEYVDTDGRILPYDEVEVSEKKRLREWKEKERKSVCARERERERQEMGNCVEKKRE